MVRNENLDFWIDNGYNVLFVGHAGVGKTSIVKQAFENKGLNWRYFSAATMDPWVDLVGVPKEKIDEDGSSFLDLVRCKGLDDVEAFFFDELNRSHKKVRNAVMELIQFKTINGKPFKKLKAVWAAINPDDDDTYDVEKLDPAQSDRFHVRVDLPYKPDSKYFSDKYGILLSKAAISWWNEMPSDIKKVVSPRRLDYALEIYSKKGDIRYVLPEQSNVTKLLTAIKIGPIQEVLDAMQKSQDKEAAMKFLAIENNYQSAIHHIRKSKTMLSYFAPLLPDEKLSVLASDPNTLKHMVENLSEPAFRECIKRVFAAKTDKGAIRELSRMAKRDRDLAATIGVLSKGLTIWEIGKSPEPYYYNAKASSLTYSGHLDALMKALSPRVGGNFLNTADRRKVYEELRVAIPPTLGVTEAVRTLELLAKIASRSHDRTLKNMPNFMGIVNHCFSQIHNLTKDSLVQINKKFDKKYIRLWKCIVKDRELASKLMDIK